MKKIKYGNRNNQSEHRQLNSLKAGDQICEAVLDTLSDDYLNYITHLVRHSKTPVKANNRNTVEQPSSDSQPPPQLTPTNNTPLMHQQRVRHHSETGHKPHPLEYYSKTIEEPEPRKLSFHRQTVQRDKNIGQKRKKKAGGYQQSTTLKDQQKTMSFTRNIKMQPLGFARGEQPQRRGEGSRGRGHGRQGRQQLYDNFQYSEGDNERISINQHMVFTQEASQRSGIFHPFINQIDSYISLLESNRHLETGGNYSFSRKDKKGRRESGERRGVREERRRDRDYQGYSEQEVQELLKENLKLSKKVRYFQEKTQDLEDEISSHLIQCKHRDKHFKSKIAQFLKVITQADAKVSQQKQQIKAMKGLLRSFGQKAKQIEHQQEDSDDGDEDDITQSIVRQMASRHRSELRTKHKRALEQTMPRQEERHYWCE